jgi:DNA-directed RNA polymerase specialized sigma24 family protein
MQIAFWKSHHSSDGQSSNLGTWLYSVAMKIAKGFKRRSRKGRKRDECRYANPVFVEQDRTELRILEEFVMILSDLDRRIFTMYLDDDSYEEMSAKLGLEEAVLRERMSRIKEHFKAQYGDR